MARLIILLIIFLLPIQSRYIYSELTLNGEVFEYGKLSVYLIEILILIAFLFQSRKKNLATKGLFFFLGALFLSVAFSVNSVLAFSAILHVAFALLFFFLLKKTKIDRRHIAIAFVSGLIIPAALGWFQVITGTSPESTLLGLAGHEAATLGDAVIETEQGVRVLRAYGTFSHPNVFGGFLAVGLFVAAWLSMHCKHKSHHWLLSGAVIIMSSTLIITFSRSAWLAAATGFFVLFVLMLIRRREPPRQAIPHAIIGLIAIVATLMVFSGLVFTRFDSQVRLEAKSIEERQSQYRYFDNVFLQNPFTGVGPGNYTVALEKARPGFPAWSYQPIHNSFLLIFAEIGIFGFAAFFWWNRCVFNKKILSISLLSLLFVLSLFDHYLWSSWQGLALVFFVFALITHRQDPVLTRKI